MTGKEIRDKIRSINRAIIKVKTRMKERLQDMGARVLNRQTRKSRQ